MFGERSNLEWSMDYLESKGKYPNNVELENYKKYSTKTKIKFILDDIRQENNRLLSEIEVLKRSIESNRESSFKIISDLLKEHKLS